MISLKRYFGRTLIVTLTVFDCCNMHNKKHEIELALKTYDRLVLKMDADSIAMMYTVDGELGDIARGRDSIKKFLSKFVNVKALAASSSSDRIEITNDTALQSGKYEQIDLVNNKDTVNPKGTYVAKWIWNKEEGWRIRSMATKPQ